MTVQSPILDGLMEVWLMPGLQRDRVWFYKEMTETCAAKVLSIILMCYHVDLSFETCKEEFFRLPRAGPDCFLSEYMV